MTRKRKSEWRLGLGVAAAVTFFAASIAPATAFESWTFDNSDCKMRTNFASNRDISAREAGSLARHYLRHLGFTPPRGSQRTAKVSGVDVAGENWRVSFKYGGSLPTETALFLINRNTGRIGSLAQVATATERLVVR